MLKLMLRALQPAAESAQYRRAAESELSSEDEWSGSESSSEGEMELGSLGSDEKSRLVGSKRPASEGPAEPSEAAEAKGSHWAVSAALLFNGLVGGGLLGLPYAVVAAGGLGVALPLIALYGVLACVNHLVLAKCADLTGTNTFQNMVRELLGELGNKIVVVILLLVSFIINIFLLIGIADMLRSGTRAHFGHQAVCQHWYFSRWWLILVMVVVVIGPSCLVKHIDGLKWVSGAATLGVFYVVGSVVINFARTPKEDLATDLPTAPANWHQFLMAMPGIGIAFGNHFASVSVYARQRDRRVGAYAKAVLTSGLSGAGLYCLVSLLVVLVFGSTVQDDFIKSYQDAGSTMTLAIFVYALKLTLEYPLFQFVGWIALESLLGWLGFQLDKVWWFWRRLWVSVCWVGLSAGAGLWLPAVSYFTPLLGALTISISFVFPALCLLAATAQPRYAAQLQHHTLLRCLGGAMLLLGAVLIGSSLLSVPTAIRDLHELQQRTEPAC